MPVVEKTDDLQKMTVDEFRQWSETQDGRWELHDGVPIRLHDPARGHAERIEHIDAKTGAAFTLRRAIEQAAVKCRAVGDGATVEIDETTSYEPDALVYCGKRLEKGSITVPDPVIIVEVLSPSTGYKDVSTKLADYFRLPSVMHYLIIDPKLERVQHHYRDGEKIKLNPLDDDLLQLDPPGIELQTADFFA